MSVLRMTPEQRAAHQKRVKTRSPEMGAAIDGLHNRRGPPIAGETNAQKAQEGPKTGAGRDFPASGVQPPRKYRNRPTGGYSSGKEARRAAELKLLEKAGEIRGLREQVPFELLPKQYVGGKMVERECCYIADWVYEELQAGLWVPVVEDAKSEPTKTPEYIVKRKMMLYLKGIRVRET